MCLFVLVFQHLCAFILLFHKSHILVSSQATRWLQNVFDWVNAAQMDMYMDVTVGSNFTGISSVEKLP